MMNAKLKSLTARTATVGAAIAASLLTFGLSIAFAITSYAAGNTTTSNYWYQDGASAWHISKDAGHASMIANSWVCDDAMNSNQNDNWYLINPNGTMYEYIVQDENSNYYLLNPNHDGTFGKMVSDSGFTYNGVSFILDQNHNGTFGKILNTEAVTASKLPVTKVNLGGKPFLYTSTFGDSASSGNGYVTISKKQYYSNVSKNYEDTVAADESANSSSNDDWNDDSSYEDEFIAPSGSGSSGQSDNGSYVQRVFELVNKEREKAGLNRLSYNAAIEEAANVRAEETIELFSHTRPDDTKCFTALDDLGIVYRTAAENIAAGQRTPEEVMNSWMNSSGHRANILKSDLKAIGIGHATGGSYGNYWVQLFIG